MISRRGAGLLFVAFVQCGTPEALAQSRPAPTPIRVVTPPLTNYTPLLVARDNPSKL
jgi:hypothetical protein